MKEKKETKCERCDVPLKEHTCYLARCAGCPEGHSSFHRTVITSPQWKLWQKEQQARFGNRNTKKACYDMSEVEELGTISAGHFQNFLKFCKIIK
jgi:hypothetical protein